MSRKALTLKNGGDARTPLGDPPTTPKHVSKKNTKKWCRGKVGQEHQTVWKASAEVRGMLNTPQLVEREREWQEYRKALIAQGRKAYGNSETLVCLVCGRHLDWRWECPTS